MHLIHICSYYINDALYKNLFKELNKIGVENSAYIFANTNRRKDGLIFEDAKVSYCFNTFDKMIFHLKHWKVFRDIKKTMNVTDSDCVHAHSLFSNGYIAYRIKEEYGLPYVVTVRYPDVFTFFKWMVHLRPLGRRILKNAGAVVFLSESTKLAMKKYIDAEDWKTIENKSCIIPNGIDEYWLANRPENAKECCMENGLRIIFAGRINRNKNPEAVIRICMLMRAKGFDIKLRIVGDIEDEKYRSLFASHDFIEYFPKCKKEDLLKHYQSADIFVMLSHKETFGLVYAEAMSQGLPVIYTRGQGFDGQFEEGVAGYSCDSNSPEEAVVKIEKILEDYKSVSDRCIHLAERFAWPELVAETKLLYERTITNKYK